MGRLPQQMNRSDGIRIIVESAESRSRKEHLFNESFVLVGRHQRADLRLNSPEIGNRQLYLQVIGDRLFGVHLSTRMPTLWGRSAQPYGWINAGTILRVGQIKLGFPDLVDTAKTDPKANLNPMAGGSWPGHPVTLELQRGRSRNQSASIDRVLTLVGNSPVCKVRLNSSRVSSIHCCLVRTVEGLWIVDLVSREGVRVNGTSVRARLLAEADNLEIGGRELVVHYEKRESAKSTESRSQSTDDGISFSPTEIAVAGNLGLSASADAAETAAINSLGPLIDGFSTLQPQTVEQFRAMMATLMQAFGFMFMEHRKFVQDEMARLDELTRIIAERGAGPAAQPTPNTAPANAPADPPVPDLSVPLPPLCNAPAADQVHAWLQQRIEELGEKRSTFWERVAGLLRTKLPETPSG